MVEVLTGMGQYSYIRKQIESYRATLREIEERAGVLPDDEGLKELRQIFTNRITSLQMMMTEEARGTASPRVAKSNDFPNAA